MEVNDVALASEVLASALAAKSLTRAAEYETRVLRTALDSQQTAAAQLLKTLGIGQNLNVVG